MAIKKTENKPKKEEKEKPVKSEKAHAKAEENDAQAGHTQPKLVDETPEMKLNQLFDYRRRINSLQSELVDAEQAVKEIKDDISKNEAKILLILDTGAGVEVQQKLKMKAAKNDDKRFMDQSSYKTPEELRRHPQEAAEA